MHDRITRAAEPKIERGFVRGCSRYREFRFDGVSRADDGHVGKSPHDTDVLGRVMGRPVGAVAETATDSHDRHRYVVVTNIVANLLEAPQRCECGNRVDKRPEALEG